MSFAHLINRLLKGQKTNSGGNFSGRFLTEFYSHRKVFYKFFEEEKKIFTQQDF